MPSPASLTVFLLLLPLFHAHSAPKTPAELAAHEDAQRAIYHCLPAIAAQLEQRKAAAFVDQTAARLDTLAFGSGRSLHSDPDSDSDDAQTMLRCEEAARLSRIRNSTCVLSPVTRSGPYYHRSGHPIRQNLAEWQDGLPFWMDIGVIDVATCEPVTGALVDVWHANATGFYAGHPRPAPELVDERPQVGGRRAGLLTAYPRANFDEQWLRGAWATDAQGVARFATIFPGHYTGRATHIHAEVHLDWTPTDNGTFSSPHVAYIGQFFFPDDLNLAVDKMWPYNSNPVRDRTRNWRDSLMVFQESHANGFQPVFEIEKLGAVVRQGLVGFMTVGVNLSARYDHHWQPQD